MKQKYLIVTRDLIGPVRNGGIGTACTALAETFVKTGYEVHILWVPGMWVEDQEDNITRHIKAYADKKISLIPLPNPDAQKYSQDDYYHSLSHRVYDWCKDKEYDAIIVHEWGAIGGHLAAGRKQGKVKSPVIAWAHSPTVWHVMGDQLTGTPQILDFHAIELMTLRWADAIVAPSGYLLDWLREHGVYNERMFVVRNFMTEKMKEMAKPYERQPEPIEHIVFFGRLERRKGIHLFVDAILNIMQEYEIDITFLGKNSAIGGSDSVSWIENRLGDSKRPYRVEIKKNQPEALEIISQPRTLVCMPSIYENYPYTVLEALNMGVPFVTCRTGGIPEMVHSDALLCDPSAKDLEVAIKAWLDDTSHIMDTVIEDLDPDVNEPDDAYSWESVFKIIDNMEPFEMGITGHPFVSVIVPTYNRPPTLERTLESVANQDYDNFECIVVDDHSSEIFHEVNKNLVEKHGDGFIYHYKDKNEYLGPARNTGVDLAGGDYVIFLDDDNVLMPNAIEEMVNALLASKADVAVSPLRIFQGVPENIVSDYYFTGELASGFFHNKMGDAMSIWKKSIVSGYGHRFTDDRAGHEDWELLVEVALEGFRIFPMVDPIFLYQQSGDGMLISGDPIKNIRRSMRPWFETRSDDHVLQLIFEIAFSQSRAVNMLEHRLRKLYQEHSKLVEWAEKIKAQQQQSQILTPDMMRRYGRR